MLFQLLNFVPHFIKISMFIGCEYTVGGNNSNNPVLHAHKDLNAWVIADKL